MKKIIQHNRISNGYIKFDLFNAEFYFFVPSYTKAKKDMVHVKYNNILRQMIHKILSSDTDAAQGCNVATTMHNNQHKLQ